MLLWRKVAQECATWCCTSATRDYNTVASRTEHEGLSFLTITLPTFGKALEKALDQGYVDHNLFSGFAWKGGLPRFLGGFLDRVFDRTSGLLLESPCIDSIRSIRQLTLMFGKMELPCTDLRTAAAYKDYIECEQEVRDADIALRQTSKSDFEAISAMLYARAYTNVDRQVYEGTLVPRHGPGATADKIRGNSKFSLRTWTRRLEEYFPCGEYLLPNWGFLPQLDDVELLEPGAEQPVRVVSVPKTLKTPRIIGIEPACMQYTQQALLPAILEELERDDILGSFLGFKDQDLNQEMARQGSRDGSLATLDLSEASDRVSNQHVRLLLRNHPHLFNAVDACRSRKADVPGFGVQRLAKFASMGSALCFPFEAMVFLTVVLIGIQNGSSKPLTRRDLLDLRGKVRIYGDDIIVPVDTVHSVVEALQAFGFVVNFSKSFWTGKFRESCGGDYYHGDDVSVVKVRRLFPTRPRHGSECESIVSLRNQLYKAGYWQTVSWLDSYIEKVLKWYPSVHETSRVLGRHTFLQYETQKMCPKLHAPLVKGYVARPILPVSNADGIGAMLKCFLLWEYSINEYTEGSTAVRILGSQKDHLERAGRPKAVNIKPGWASPF